MVKSLPFKAKVMGLTPVSGKKLEKKKKKEKLDTYYKMCYNIKV